jgi:hypothetical protein
MQREEMVRTCFSKYVFHLMSAVKQSTVEEASCQKFKLGMGRTTATSSSWCIACAV